MPWWQRAPLAAVDYSPQVPGLIPACGAEGQQREERERNKYPAGERLMERKVRSKLGRKGWREQDSGSDEGLRSEQEGEKESAGANVRQRLHAEGMGMARKEEEGQGRQKALPVSCCGKDWDGLGWAAGTGLMRGPAIKRSPQPKQ